MSLAFIRILLHVSAPRVGHHQAYIKKPQQVANYSTKYSSQSSPPLLPVSRDSAVGIATGYGLDD
jgi:hypothetical protein